MKYIPGQIHESFQKLHFFEVKREFVWINCDKRYSDFKNSFDWDNHITPVDTKPGDILVIRFFNYGLRYNQFSSAYCYLEKIISGDVEVEFFTETMISREFLEANTTSEFPVFTDISIVMERDKKINQIINQ